MRQCGISTSKTGRGLGDVAAQKCVDAVDSSPEAGGVVSTARRAEEGVVEMLARGVVVIVPVQRRVEGAADGGLGRRVGRGRS